MSQEPDLTDETVEVFRVQLTAAQTAAMCAPMKRGWFHIHSAPRGVDVLTFEAGEIAVSRLHVDSDGRLVWSGGGYCDPSPNPTHWMPLPEAPAGYIPR